MLNERVIKAIFRMKESSITVRPMKLATYMKVTNQEAKKLLDELNMHLYGKTSLDGKPSETKSRRCL